MGKKVLIVDDSMVFRKKIEKKLKDHDCEIITASDGADGFSKFKSNEGIAIVFSDLNMPNKSGLEMIEDIRQELEPENTKFIIISSVGHGTEEQREKSKRIGIDYWISKPIQDEQISVLIDGLMRQ